jgi:hypothetical protein
MKEKITGIRQSSLYSIDLEQNRVEKKLKFLTELS